MKVTGKTAILLMFADPVSHIRGTDIINSNFAALGLDALIVPLHVKPADLAAGMDMARRTANVAGLGITIPHKIAALPLMDDLTDAARRLGAVNFVRRNADSTLTGTNTDGAGFVAGLRANGFDPQGKRALVVGTGGVGRAIAFALADAGVSDLRLVNRSPASALALAAEIAAILPECHVTALDIADPHALSGLDLLVNATSLGMSAADALPIALGGLTALTTVAEVVVNPPMTALLTEAARRGCAVVPGAEMLTPQPRLVAEFLNLHPAAL
jgi:shikimate dehydrogenase